MKAIDCQGLGGGFTLGVHQAGFDIVSKHEQPGGFGFKQAAENRHLLGEFPLDDSAPEDWFVDADMPYVFGCPPCSGFSMMSVRSGGLDRRGCDATINNCMWDFVRYAARAHPQIITMESVTAAAKMGKPLMRQLQQELMDLTGHGWYMTLLHHNAYSVGGVAMRPRVFMVWSQTPFGIRTPRPTQLPLLKDAIGDLLPLELQWNAQARKQAPGWWEARKADSDLVTGHTYADADSRKARRIEGLHETGLLLPGDSLTSSAEKYWESTGGVWDRETGQVITPGEFPPGYDQMEIDRVVTKPAAKADDYALVTKGEMTIAEYNEKYDRKMDPTTIPHPFITSMYETIRWGWEKPARVFTGGGMRSAVHPLLGRTFTYREAARIMGFPDSWNLDAYIGGEATFGKAVTVDVGYWLGYWVKNHLENLSGQRHDDLWYGVDSEDGYLETTIDCSRDWQQLADSKAGAAIRAAIEKRPA